jgi:hypothetical protein
MAFQTPWRLCFLCNGMFFSGRSTGYRGGVCPIGMDHGGTSTVYALAHNSPQAGSQGNWRWCRKCEGLFFHGMATDGFCPAGGAHDASSSGEYHVRMLGGIAPKTKVVGPSTWIQWRWCSKCYALFWYPGGNQKGICPKGGGHDSNGSGYYAVLPVEKVVDE